MKRVITLLALAGLLVGCATTGERTNLGSSETQGAPANDTGTVRGGGSSSDVVQNNAFAEPYFPTQPNF